eukprot:scaffold14557_cov67-Attheya_sp.AAC.11
MVRSTLVAPALASVLLASSCLAEIRQFDDVFKAASSVIHYSEGYVTAPGFVDLNDLVFSTADDFRNTEYDDQYFDDDNSDKDDAAKETAKPSPAPTGPPTKPPTKSPTKPPTNPPTLAPTEKPVTETDATEDGDGDGDERALDTKTRGSQPPRCAKSRNGCDWTKLGVGASDENGNLRWCCSKDAIKLGLCKDRRKGRLIVDPAVFSGERRSLWFPDEGGLTTRVHESLLEVHQSSGNYVLIFANCNDHGRNVLVHGDYAWKSKHGYLPGDMIGALYFFVALTVVYLLVFMWYGISMKCYEDSTIPIQKWMLYTICFGFLETFFNTGNLFIVNLDGQDFWLAMYGGVIIGVVKRAISRCLIVMVSLGWGVVRDTLDNMRKITIFGVLYAVAALARDLTTIFARAEVQELSTKEENELLDIVTILTFVVAAIDVIFYMWILDSLNATMEYLESMSQRLKLLRYLRLRSILLFSILFAVVWAVFGLVNDFMDERMLDDDQEWAIEAAWDVNYLLVLVGVAVLWRPNPRAKEYAFVMELPTIAEENENEMDFQTNADTIDDDDEF